MGALPTSRRLWSQFVPWESLPLLEPPVYRRLWLRVVPWEFPLLPEPTVAPPAVHWLGPGAALRELLTNAMRTAKRRHLLCLRSGRASTLRKQAGWSQPSPHAEAREQGDGWPPPRRRRRAPILGWRRRRTSFPSFPSLPTCGGCAVSRSAQRSSGRGRPGAPTRAPG